MMFVTSLLLLQPTTNLVLSAGVRRLVKNTSSFYIKRKKLRPLDINSMLIDVVIFEEIGLRAPYA